MEKVLLISNDKKLHSFCQKLHSHHIYVMPVSPFSTEIGGFFCQASIVLLDFELIKNGHNVITEEVYSLCNAPQVIPLVKEDSMGMAMHLLHCSYEDIVALPCCVEFLYAHILRCIEQRELALENTIENDVVEACIGISDEMIAFKKKLVAVAKNELSVLILGETGTGKSFIARMIHQLSSRSNKKFVEENIAAIQETLIEGELFGTKLGAYTGAISRIGLFEHANGGTIFLDEIACIKNTIQAKLLQVLETGAYRPVGSVEMKTSDVRLICATNVPLEKLKDKDSFREDLYYRISGIQLHIPALRKRIEDILPLSRHFLKILIEKNGIQKELAFDAISKLEAHTWPGNIRELERCIECAYLMTPQTTISGRDITFVS